MFNFHFNARDCGVHLRENEQEQRLEMPPSSNNQCKFGNSIGKFDIFLKIGEI